MVHFFNFWSNFFTTRDLAGDLVVFVLSFLHISSLKDEPAVETKPAWFASSVRQGWHHQIHGVDNRLFGPNTFLILALWCWFMVVQQNCYTRLHVARQQRSREKSCQKDGMLIMFFLSRVKRKKRKLVRNCRVLPFILDLFVGLDWRNLSFPCFRSLVAGLFAF